MSKYCHDSGIHRCLISCEECSAYYDDEEFENLRNHKGGKEMLFELESGILVNIIQIITVEKRDTNYSFMLENGTEIICEYDIHMTDKCVVYATKKDVEQLKEQKND